MFPSGPIGARNFSLYLKPVLTAPPERSSAPPLLKTDFLSLIWYINSSNELITSSILSMLAFPSAVELSTLQEYSLVIIPTWLNS